MELTERESSHKQVCSLLMGDCIRRTAGFVRDFATSLPVVELSDREFGLISVQMCDYGGIVVAVNARVLADRECDCSYYFGMMSWSSMPINVSAGRMTCNPK
jgi:hypothetical protein